VPIPFKWRNVHHLPSWILNTGHPPYLTELLQYHKLARSTHSSASHLLSVPRHNLSFVARAFRVAAPKIWNSIPLHIRQSQTYSSFRRHLKTHYFISAHLAPIAAPVMRPDSLPRLWRYINLLLTYLLTYFYLVYSYVLVVTSAVRQNPGGQGTRGTDSWSDDIDKNFASKPTV